MACSWWTKSWRCGYLRHLRRLRRDERKEMNKKVAIFAFNGEKAGIIDCVCKACSTQTGALESAEEQGLPICSEMSGHPSLSRYMEAGYEVIVF